METIIYLRQNTLGTNGVKAYNRKQLTSIYYFQNGNSFSSEKKKYDDLENLEFSLNLDLGAEQYNYRISDRETFNKVAIDFTNNYNNLIKEL